MSLIPIKEEVPTGEVMGEMAPHMAPVLEAFLANFRTRGEVGAALTLYHQGEKVMDVWGGQADARAALPWRKDTIIPVFSCGKAILAILALRLVEAGKLALDEPVTALWPEYGVRGKEDTTLRMMLDHRSGLPACREILPKGAFLDWEGMVRRLEEAAPFFEPGTKSAYQGYTHAWLVGEMIRRASGKKPGALFAEEIAGPLGLDLWVGVPESEEPRLARLLKPQFTPETQPTAFMKALADKDSIPWLFLGNDGGFRIADRSYRASDIASANTIGTARSLAKLYAPLSIGGEMDGVKITGQSTIEEMIRITNDAPQDGTLCTHLRFSAGFMRTVLSERRTIAPIGASVPGDKAFGHGGAGGSLGFAEPQLGLSFGYVMNQMGIAHLINERGRVLVDAAYGALA